MRSFRPTVAALVAAAVVTSGCGGGDADATPTSSTLTREQAAQLAEVLVDNLDSQGAAFVVSARTAAGDTLNMTGEVDWAGHRGVATIVATGPESGLYRIIWTDDVMLEQRPALLAQVADAENLTAEWIARPPSPPTRTLDKIVAIIASLAGDQIDNAVLIAQAPGSAYLGTDTVDGREVAVLRYGERNRYWLADDGELVRFEQPPLPGNDAILIDFSDRGPRSVDLPAADAVVDARALGDLYPFP